MGQNQYTRKCIEFVAFLEQNKCKFINLIHTRQQWEMLRLCSWKREIKSFEKYHPASENENIFNQSENYMRAYASKAHSREQYYIMHFNQLRVLSFHLFLIALPNAKRRVYE